MSTAVTALNFRLRPSSRALIEKLVLEGKYLFAAWRIVFPGDEFGPGFILTGACAMSDAGNRFALMLVPVNTGSQWYLPSSSMMEWFDFWGNPIDKPSWVTVSP